MIQRMLALTLTLTALTLLPARGDDKKPRRFEGKTAIEWAKAPDNDKPGTRRAAAFALAKMGPDAVPAVKKLIVALKDTDDGVRYYSIQALGLIGSQADKAVPQLVIALKDARFGRSAAVALGRIGKSSVTPVCKALKDDSPAVRRLAALTLAFVGSDAADAAPLLAERLGDDSFLVRRMVVRALTLIQPPAKGVLEPLLKTIATDTDADVCRLASAALGKIGKPAVA